MDHPVISSEDERALTRCDESRFDKRFDRDDERYTLQGKWIQPDYTPDTIIPNPARRRLELSLKVTREHEGTLRRKLASQYGGQA